MTDIELLPLPKWLLEGFTDPTIERLCDYARAVAEHNVAARDAEIEALRAEVEAWRELSDHVRAGACNAIWPDRYTDARTRDVAAALKRAERLAEALRDIESRPWNGVRPIQIAARAALRDHDQEGGNP